MITNMLDSCSHARLINLMRHNQFSDSLVHRENGCFLMVKLLKVAYFILSIDFKFSSLYPQCEGPRVQLLDRPKVYTSHDMHRPMTTTDAPRQTRMPQLATKGSTKRDRTLLL